LPGKSVSWPGRMLAIARKDIVTELRTRYAINAVIMFALVTLVVISLSLRMLVPDEALLAAIFWIIFFFASMSGLARTFVREEEAGTALLLKLSADGTAIFFGKLLFNLFLLIVLSIFIIPLFVVLLNSVPKDWAIFLAGWLLGIIGLAGSTTIIAAMVAKASVKGALFAVLSFPILMPLLLIVVGITEAGLTGGNPSGVATYIQLVAAYDVAMMALSMVLFDFVWRQQV